jgi:hypothetical protein
MWCWVGCKGYSRPAGVDVVNSFAAISHLLKQRGLIDKAAIVAAAGFTTQARDAARAHDLDLLEFADIKQRVRDSEGAVRQARRKIEVEDQTLMESAERPKRLFVIMPFLKDFQDVYILGIREVAVKLGMVAERADDIEHNEGVLGVITERIRDCDAVVAEVTGQNPNVFYEVGYSHATGKPTILLSRRGQEIPFDLRGMNHIIYETIVELREKLEKRLRATLPK